MTRRHLVCTLVGTLLQTSCATTVTGTPLLVFADPFSVAGMPAVNGPTGGRRASAVDEGRCFKRFD